jgi:hypothetical protein
VGLRRQALLAKRELALDVSPLNPVTKNAFGRVRFSKLTDTRIYRAETPRVSLLPFYNSRPISDW